MKSIIITPEENKCLRECLNTIEKILSGKGLSLGSVANDRKAAKREPSQKEKVNNYMDLLSKGSKYEKPKHLKNKN